MQPEALVRLVHEDPDFVNSKRFGYSLARVLERYPDGAPPHLIATLLMIPEDEISDRYDQIVNKLRIGMGITL